MILPEEVDLKYHDNTTKLVYFLNIDFLKEYLSLEIRSRLLYKFLSDYFLRGLRN